MTLDYRLPDTPEHRVVRVQNELNTEEAIDWLMAVVKLVVGVPLTLAPPFFIAGIFVRRIAGVAEVFDKFFVVVCLIVLPIMFYLERRERQDYLWEAAREGFEWTVLDILLIGPRLLLSLFDQIDRKQPGQQTLALAAKIVVEMLDARQSIAVAQLLRDDRTMDEVAESLKHLERRGWIIVSRNRARAWLGTSIRKQFEGMTD